MPIKANLYYRVSPPFKRFARTITCTEAHHYFSHFTLSINAIVAGIIIIHLSILSHIAC